MSGISKSELSQVLRVAAAFAFLSAGVSACADTISWKEEVLLHDGRTLVVQRTQSTDPDGLREIGQPPPQSEESLQFTVPGQDQAIRWQASFGRGYEDNLTLLLLDLYEGVPYIATQVTRCHTYNKWGRPNPPYVFFRFEDGTWQRVTLADFPAQSRKANVLIGGYLAKARRLTQEQRAAAYLSVESIQRLNRIATPDTWYLREIARAPINVAQTIHCGRLVYYKGAWVGPGDSIGKRMMDRISRMRNADDTKKGNLKEGTERD